MMRLSIGSYAALGLGLFYVAGTLFLHSWRCRYRLHRACRLYDAGRVAEADHLVAAVRRSVAEFRRLHPRWSHQTMGASQ